MTRIGSSLKIKKTGARKTVRQLFLDRRLLMSLRCHLFPVSIEEVCRVLGVYRLSSFEDGFSEPLSSPWRHQPYLYTVGRLTITTILVYRDT